MVGVNKVILIGNLGRNPDVVCFNQEGHRPDGPAGEVVKKASFPLATTEIRKNKDGEKVEQTEWHTVVCWRGLAEIAEKLLRKGTPIYVEGKLQTRSWEDKEGNKRYITEVVAENFNVLSTRPHSESATHEDSHEPVENIVNSETSPLGDLPF